MGSFQFVLSRRIRGNAQVPTSPRRLAPVTVSIMDLSFIHASIDIDINLCSEAAFL